MLRGFLTASLLTVSLLAAPVIGNAQYIYLDANGDGVNSAADRLNASGATSLDVWLNTNHDRDGSLQSCNSHNGAPTSGAPLDLFSYAIVLQTVGGTVSWGTFVAADPAFTVDGTDLADNHDTEFNRSRPAGSVTPPGLVKLGTIPVTVVSGAPSVRFGTSTPIDPFGFGTGFGTDCDAGEFPNTYVLASLGAPTGDWFDTDGVAAPASSNTAPSLSAPSSVTAPAGDPVTITATATDADAADVLTITATGAPASLAFSPSPGPSPATATLSGTPLTGEAAGSPYSIQWAVNDGAGGNASANTSLTVTRTDAPPTVSAPDTSLFAETIFKSFGVGASDPDGDAITSLTPSALPSGATFSVNAFNAAGNFEWTPALGQAGTYPITFTAQSGAPSLSASATTIVRVGPRDRRPVVTGPTGVTVNEGAPVTVTETASDPDGDPMISFVASGTQNTALPPGLTYTVNASNTSMTLNWTPTFSQSGIYSIDVEATSSGSLGPQISVPFVLKFTVRNVNAPPALSAPSSLSVNEGMPISFSVSATDGDGDHVTLSAPSRPIGAGFIDHGDNTGTFDWTPGFGQAGTYTVTFAGNDGHGGVATAATVISVSNVNRAPVANPDGPYSGLTNVPVNFNGSGSSDPDGDALTYMWSFGDGGTGTGVTPSHTYTGAGSFTVDLTVTDSGAPPLSSTASTSASISSVLAARTYVVGGNSVIKLNSGKPTWCAQIEPVSGNFNLADVNLSTLVLKYGTSQIPGGGTKTTIGLDKDGNGVSEIGACFSKPDLRTLFAGLPSGKTHVSLTVEADLVGGGKIQGSIEVDVQKGGSGSAIEASVSPNPLNPKATLSFVMERPGSARVGLYDLSGRLVRNLMQESFASAGYHELTIDGRGQNGEKLPSGVYFYNIRTAEGAASGRLTILK